MAKTRFEWDAEKQFMSAKIKYTNEPLGKVKVIADFLPSPAKLAFNEEGVKVTLALSKTRVPLFFVKLE